MGVSGQTSYLAGYFTLPDAMKCPASESFWKFR